MSRFETNAFGRIIHVNPWPTLGRPKEKTFQKVELLRTPVPVRRGGVVVRELTPPVGVFPHDAA